MTQLIPAYSPPVAGSNGPEATRTIGQAVALGLLSLNVQVAGFGVGAQSPTLQQLLSDGLVSNATLVSTLTFVGSTALPIYGGN